MFGLSFTEIMVIVIVGIVVVGPRQLPTMMRTAGRWLSKLRRMSTDLRSQSGIDDLIRQEGLEKEIRELRSFSRMNVIETLVNPTSGPVVTATPRLPAPSTEPEQMTLPLREHEYPVLGCDSYGAYCDEDDLDDEQAPEQPTTTAVDTEVSEGDPLPS